MSYLVIPKGTYHKSIVNMYIFQTLWACLNMNWMIDIEHQCSINFMFKHISVSLFYITIHHQIIFSISKKFTTNIQPQIWIKCYVLVKGIFYYLYHVLWWASCSENMPLLLELPSWRAKLKEKQTQNEQRTMSLFTLRSTLLLSWCTTKANISSFIHFAFCAFFTFN